MSSKFQVPVKVKLTVYRKDKRGKMDDSNLIASADKLIADNLVTQKIIVDDTADYLTWEKPKQFVGKPERVIVEIKGEQS